MRLWTPLAALALMILPASAQPVRVGIFDKPSIVIAFYRSPQWAYTLGSKTAEMEEAKKTNDTRKVEELENWGKSGQERAHQQLMGEASVANILEALAPAFPEIARKAQVSLIAADLPYSDASVQTVDVTGLLLDWLKADDRTRAIIREMRNHPGPPPAIH